MAQDGVGAVAPVFEAVASGSAPTGLIDSQPFFDPLLDEPLHGPLGLFKFCSSLGGGGSGGGVAAVSMVSLRSLFSPRGIVVFGL